MPPAAIRTIVVSTDLSPGADEVVRQAGRLAAHAGAELHLLHAVAPLEPDSIGERAQQTYREREEDLRKLAGRALPPELAGVHAQAVGGTPDVAVLQYAQRVRPDVVVVGPHRGSKLDARVLGTTAERILRQAEVPCLVVRGTIPVPLQRIGVPTDLSEPAQNALRVAVAWAAALGAPSTAVRALHVGWAVDAADDPGRQVETLRPKLNRQIEEALRSTAAPEQVAVDAEIVWGNRVGEEIRIWSQDERVDLLVTGTRGAGGLKRALLGSVATELAQEAPCSVLVVPEGYRGDSWAPS